MNKEAGKVLSNKTLRMTRQRQIILEELQKDYSHPTASVVYQKVRRRLPQISLGTVYRNLEVLSEQGLIKKLELSGTQKRFDGTLSEHYHVRCFKCGRISDVSMKTLTALDEKLSEICDYEIIGHRLEFIGLCPKCKKAKKRARKTKTTTPIPPGNIS